MPSFSQHLREVSDTRLIQAKPEAVYRAIQEARTACSSRKLVSYKDHKAIIEEDFTCLPVLGTAHCIYQEVETSPSRIDYSLISSDKLAKFEGAWILTPVDNGKRTSVQLISATESSVKFPFADRLTFQSTTRRVEQRLQEIANSAEEANLGALTQSPTIAKK
jgi:uncharacterized protein YndB with AHSA1/START domain